MNTSKDLVEKSLKLASKWSDTTVFGGYVRDMLGSSESQLNDLDLHFKTFSNMRGFVDILSIFANVEEIESPFNRSKYDEKDTKTFDVTCNTTGSKLKIDVVYPIIGIGDSSVIPININNLDFDVNGAFLAQEAGCGGVFNSVKTLSMISIIHIMDRAKQKHFSCVNTPMFLATGKNDLERKKSEIGKAIKLVYRAEKMVKRGWVQDGLAVVGKVKAVSPYWHVSSWIENEHNKLVCYPVDSDPAWDSIRERVYEQKTCSLCHAEYKPGQTILVPKCGHTAHIACCDYEEKDEEIEERVSDRSESGIVGWFAKQNSKLCFENQREALQCPTCRCQIFN